MEPELNEARYLDLLRNLIGSAEQLQNSPIQELVPREDLAVNQVLKVVEHLSTSRGGPLVVEKLTFVAGRSNLLITYPGSSTQTVTFAGSHLDVVPANPENWDSKKPFELIQDGDRLCGRGTTDCLGHVALLTELLLYLGETKPELKRSVHVLFISNEENSTIPGIGVDAVYGAQKMEMMKNGPVYWVDSADTQPCIGTAGVMQWSLKAIGKLFHSGLPDRAINPIELLMEATSVIQKHFYTNFTAHPSEEKWNYLISSTFKPTQFETAKGSLNQIPPYATMYGDIRLTPFYKMDDCKASIEKCVEDINSNMSTLPSRGPWSKYELPLEGISGKLELSWMPGSEAGVACNIDSEGYRALSQATREVVGELKPYSISGTLPLVKWLQDCGFDIQIVGYGKSSVYHADNEYALFSDMKKAFKILINVVMKLDQTDR